MRPSLQEADICLKRTDFFRRTRNFELADNFIRRRFSIGRSKLLVRSIRDIPPHGGDSLSVNEISSPRASNLDNFIRAYLCGEYFFAPKILRAAESRHFANFARHKSANG